MGILLHDGRTGRIGDGLRNVRHIGGTQLAGMILLQIAHHGPCNRIGILMPQGTRQMRSGRAADDARPLLQRAERRPTPAVLIGMAFEQHLAPGSLMELGHPLPLVVHLRPAWQHPAESNTPKNLLVGNSRTESEPAVIQTPKPTIPSQPPVKIRSRFPAKPLAFSSGQR